MKYGLRTEEGRWTAAPSKEVALEWAKHAYAGERPVVVHACGWDYIDVEETS